MHCCEASTDLDIDSARGDYRGQRRQHHQHYYHYHRHHHYYRRGMLEFGFLLYYDGSAGSGGDYGIVHSANLQCWLSVKSSGLSGRLNLHSGAGLSGLCHFWFSNRRHHGGQRLCYEPRLLQQLRVYGSSV
jgi:hypothetical protein